MPSLLYLAAADARGHLMRGHLVRALCAPHGIDVKLVTTSPAGVEFLATLGDPATCLPGGWHIPFRDGQDLDRAEGWRVIRDYALRGLAADHAMLRDADADLVVCDGHPAPLVAHLPFPAVHVTSESMWATVRAEAGLWPVDLLRRHAWAEICHGADIDAATRGRGRRWRLPTLIATPEATHVGEAVVYLNPHFRDPALAARIEAALAPTPLYAVGEGFAGRPGWRALDPRFVDHAVGAAVIVSAPGMAAVSLARRFRIPMIAIDTDQPEQRRNLAMLADVPHAVVPVDGDFAAALRSLGPAASRPHPESVVAPIQAAWLTCLTTLLAQAGVSAPESACSTSSSTPKTSATSLPAR